MLDIKPEPKIEILENRNDNRHPLLKSANWSNQSEKKEPHLYIIPDIQTRSSRFIQNKKVNSLRDNFTVL